MTGRIGTSCAPAPLCAGHRCIPRGTATPCTPHKTPSNEIKSTLQQQMSCAHLTLTAPETEMLFVGCNLAGRCQTRGLACTVSFNYWT